jgi:hypothetical protein
MRKAKLLLVLPFLAPFAVYACGGGGEAANPATSATATATATPPASTTAAAASSSAAVAEPKPPEPSYMLGITASKMTPDKTAKIKAIEVKDDGSVNLGGKPTYKLAGGALLDSTGTAMLKCIADGTVTQGDGKAFGKFDDKDVMQVAGGASITIGDDGVVKVLDKPGSPSKTIKGKFDKVDAKGRRADVMIVSIEWMLAASAPH